MEGFVILMYFLMISTTLQMSDMMCMSIHITALVYNPE